MPTHQKKYVNSFVDGDASLKDIIQQCKENILMRIYDDSIVERDQGLDYNW